MSKNLVYFVPGIENATKRKHLLFLQKSGFTIAKVNTLEALPIKIDLLEPIVVILNDEFALKEALPLVGETPIIVLSKTNKNIQEIMGSLPETNNIIFFRTEADPIDSLLETINLCSRVYGTDEDTNITAVTT
jgi:hypothetical protein